MSESGAVHAPKCHYETVVGIHMCLLANHLLVIAQVSTRRGEALELSCNSPIVHPFTIFVLFE